MINKCAGIDPVTKAVCGHRQHPSPFGYDKLPTRGHFRGVGECYECGCRQFVPRVGP